MTQKNIYITQNGNLSQMEFLRLPFWARCFSLYVNDISNIIFDVSNPVLYADNTSLIITNSDSQKFEKKYKYYYTTIKQMV